ncbi:MAG: cytochrome c, partial [Waterburya sp.]
SDKLPQENADYSSIKTEKIAAVPYWIWLMLPRVFPEYLPDSGGYLALGVTWEAGAELPVGFSKKTIALSSLYSTDRQTKVNPSPLIDQETSSNFDLQGYRKFLADCAKDPRFKPGYILKEINDYYYTLSPWEKQLYRFIVIPKTKEQLQV